MNHCYTWEYHVTCPPYDKIVDVIEAFFASYPGGDYTCERRETYRLQFRRGEWKKSLFGMGELAPHRMPKGQFNRWPFIVYALVRPSPSTFLITVRYELYLPKSMPKLIPELQSTVNAYCRRELEDLAAYLAECMGTTQKPVIVDA
jgi:hypothetical protein